MNDKGPSYQERTYTIPAGGAVDHHRHGTSFGCLDASGPFFVKLGNEPRTQFAKGLTFEAPEPFNSVRIENRGNTPISVTVFVADGRLNDARLTLPADLVAFTGAARSIRSGSEDVASGQRKRIVQADPERLELRITNQGGSPVFLGDDQVIFGSGLPLAAGHSTTLKIQAEIYAYAQADGIQKLAILETLK